MTLKYIWRSFSLSCHFHVHFSYLWHAFASHGLPAIAELLVNVIFGDDHPQNQDAGFSPFDQAYWTYTISNRLNFIDHAYDVRERCNYACLLVLFSLQLWTKYCLVLCNIRLYVWYCCYFLTRTVSNAVATQIFSSNFSSFFPLIFLPNFHEDENHEHDFRCPFSITYATMLGLFWHHICTFFGSVIRKSILIIQCDPKVTLSWT